MSKCIRVPKPSATAFLMGAILMAGFAEAQPAALTLPSSMKYSPGAQVGSATYLGQTRVAWRSEGSSLYTVMPAAAVYFDPANSRPGKLCVSVDLKSEKYLQHFASQLPNSVKRSELIVADIQRLTLALGPLDGAEPIYSWVQPRLSNSNESVESPFTTCFDIGSNRDPESVARASKISAYVTTVSLEGKASECSVRVSLKDVQKRGASASSVATQGASSAVLLTGEQVTSLIAQNYADVSVNCLGESTATSKYARDQIQAVIPALLTRMQTQEASWEQLKGSMWSLGFSTSADTVIDKVRKHSNKTTTVKDLGVSAADLGKLGIGVNAKLTNTNEENTAADDTTKVTIPASIKLYRFSKSDMTQTVSMSVREFSLTGSSAATMHLHSRFVEDGILRSLHRESMATYPPNAIVGWWGSNENDLPPGWAFCDGQEHIGASGAKVRTPDLRGRFLFGGYSAIGVAAGSRQVTTDFNKAPKARVFSHFVQDPMTCRKRSGTRGDACTQHAEAVDVEQEVSSSKSFDSMPPHVNVAFICKLP